VSATAWQAVETRRRFSLLRLVPKPFTFAHGRLREESAFVRSQRNARKQVPPRFASRNEAGGIATGGPPSRTYVPGAKEIAQIDAISAR